MKVVLRSLVICMACGMAGLASSPVVALGNGSTPSEATGAPSPLSGSLAIPGSPSEGEQLQAEHEAQLASPEAVAAREASLTSFEGFNAEQATQVAGEAFPDVINELAGGPPELPADQSIARFLTDEAAEVDLGEGQHGVIESIEPMAVENSSGQPVPIDLSLTAVGAGFEPKTPLVGVRIPKQLDEGVRLDSGVSLTPTNAQGAGLGGSEGAIDGATVQYANTGTDMSSLIKPTTAGFRADTLLFSVESPQEVFFRVGLPAGATLVQATSASGAAEVIEAGVTIATILPPGAQDAAGTLVPVSMTVKGDLLGLTVASHSGEYQYPIEVDPEVNDPQLAESSSGKKSNWEFQSSNETKFGHKAVYESVGKEFLETSGTAEYKATEVAFWMYQTRGNSKIWEFNSETEGKNKEAKIESFLELQAHGTGKEENKHILSTEFFNPEYTRKPAEVICPKNAQGEQECLPTAGGEGNAIHFQQSATGSPGTHYKFSDTLYQGIVSISEPAGTHATSKFNTTSAEVEGEVEVEGKKVKQRRANALYGSGGWLSNFQDALELIAEDKGIGVSDTKLEYESSPAHWTQLSEHNYLEAENGCKGVQCFEKHSEYWTLDSKLPSGEDKIRYRAEEAMAGTKSLETEGVATIKVDTATPHKIVLAGLPFGNELSERPYELTGEATDGEGTTVASSGVKSIELYVDGTEVAEVGKQTGCSIAKGACTATAKWKINGAELGAGHHAIVIISKDRAGNEGKHEEQISIRHSTPVSFGPGSVDLESGDFSLGATDVSMGSGLTVSRNYSSRDVSAGKTGPDGGPLGPQWGLSMATTESLVELVDGSVVMTAANGSQSIFAAVLNSEKHPTGTFEPPPGNSNLTLRLEENAEKTQKLAYYLEDATAKTKVKFTLPSGTNFWVPTKQEGSVATDTVTYGYQTVDQPNEYPVRTGPGRMAAGPDGNLWFTAGSKVGKITTWGAVTEYLLPELGTEMHVNGITAGPDKNLWFTEETGYTGTGLAIVGKISPSGAPSWYYLPSGSGPNGIAPGPDGNLWFTDARTSKIGKITTSGTITEYALHASREPQNIVAGPDGNLWFTEPCGGELGCNSKIGKITTSGTVTEYSLSSSSGTDGITAGADEKLWFTEYGANKIGKITTAGAVTEYSLPAGSHPDIIAPGPDGNSWFSASESSKIGKITTAGTITEYSLPANRNPTGIAAGSDGNMWFAESFGTKIGTMTTSGKHPTIIAPTEALGPVPAGVSCAPTMNAGCRALKFTYAKATTATGENKSEWGEYEGHLKKASLNTYNPVTKAMVEVPVSEYSYDKQGRLRAQWDPRVSPALKTTYGYDTEDHVTALDPPGQEPWSLAYGTAAGDTGTGRLLKATRPPASEALWNGGAMTNTEAPKITGSPMAVGVRLATSNGKWSGSPLTYSYQWARCTTAAETCTKECPILAEGCTLILGAANANYTPTASDAGSRLVALVTVTNGGGSVKIASTASVAIAASVKTEVSEFAIGTGSWAYEIAGGPDGNVWFTDGGANKIGKKGTAFPYTTTEYALPAGSGPRGIVAGPEKESASWFTDYTTSKIGKITTAGTITEYALPVGSNPNGIAVGPDKDLWFTDYTTSKIGKITTAGTITEYALPKGGKPWGIAAGSDGNLWFTLSSVGKIGKITTAGTITEYKLPSETSTPRDIAAGPDGNLWFANEAAGKIGKITTAAAITEYTLPAGSKPTGIAAGPDGNLYFTDYGTNKVGKITPSGTITETALPAESHPRGITAGSDSNMWFTDEGTGKIGQLRGVIVEGEQQAPGAGSTIDYDVPVTGAGAPHNMSEGEVAKWGQTSEETPGEATAIFPVDSPQGWPAASYTRATVYYLDELGRTVNTARPSSSEYDSVATTEYNETNDVVRTLTPANRVTALQAGSSSVEVSKQLDTQSTYNGEGAKEKEVPEPGTKLIDTLGPQHMVKYVAGKEQKESLARNHTKFFYNEGAKEVEETTHETYNLLTKTTNLAQLANEEEVEVRKTTTSYSGQSNLGWKLRAPTSLTIDPEGLKITHTTLYNATTGQVTETRAPAGASGNSPHDSKILYYSSEENTEGYAGCGLHPAWAGLVCETLPAKQPAGAVAPKLPVTTMTYNIWNEPETTVETFGTTTRTKKFAYDEAGRLTSSETTSTANTPLPSVTDTYNSTTGALEKQTTKVGEETQTLIGVSNKLGQMETYNDSGGNTAKYKYGGSSVDNQIEEMSDSSNTGASNQKYTYDATTKTMTKLVDSAAGTFTASRNVEGKLTSEVYPNGMCANTSYNSVGETTGLEYIKTSNCFESAPVWFSETRSPSVRGETLSRTNTLASETYTYDAPGRLTQTQETPAGDFCKTRIYEYDEESNRKNLTKREPNAKKECATEGGTEEKHTYDEASRLIDAGVAYDSLDNITQLPAADAEGHELKTTFYIDNAVATQEQNGIKNEYFLDPAGRVRETVTGTKHLFTHYDGPGEAVAWTSESAEKWTRNIPGIDGTLTAIQTNGATPVLQLHDLLGDVVATAADNTTETKLLSTYNSTEFGVPNAGKVPPPYAWLGASDLASELPTGVITYGATSYVPQTGAPLQNAQVEPPGAPGGTGVGAPVNFQAEPWNMQGAAREGAEAPGLEAGREREAMEAACRANVAACPVEIVDPHWIWTFTIVQAEQLAGAIYGAEGYLTVTKLGAFIKHTIGVDFIAQLEELITKALFGYSRSDVEGWAGSLAEGLGGCSYVALIGYRHPRNPHCWVYVQTAQYKIGFQTPFGWVGPIFEVPNFDVDPQVAYCPRGTHNCYEV